MAELSGVLTPEEAYRRFSSYLAPLGRGEEVDVKDALGRVIAEELLAPCDLPSFTRSAMDGYAVRAADTYGASEGLPAYLKVVGEVLMGQAPEVGIGLGETAKVHTGGMLPGGADAVVMVERTQEVDEATIEVLRPVAVGENLIQVGEDVRRGEFLLPKGHILRPQDIGGLLALGITKIWVSQRPRVAIISSGDEVVAPEVEPGPGQVRDINTYTISALTERAGGHPLPLGIVGDSYEELLSAARRGKEEGDILVISAGSSVSVRDMTAQVISKLGEPGILVHGISIRPGKPTILAMVDGVPAFGLPGNPVSAVVVCQLFLVPTIYLLAGCKEPPPKQRVTAKLGHNVASMVGREDYVPVRLAERGEELWAEPVFGKSNLIYTLVKADGMVRVPLYRRGVAMGEMVEVELF